VKEGENKRANAGRKGVALRRKAGEFTIVITQVPLVNFQGGKVGWAAAKVTDGDSGSGGEIGLLFGACCRSGKSRHKTRGSFRAVEEKRKNRAEEEQKIFRAAGQEKGSGHAFPTGVQPAQPRGENRTPPKNQAYRKKRRISRCQEEDPYVDECNSGIPIGVESRSNTQREKHSKRKGRRKGAKTRQWERSKKREAWGGGILTVLMKMGLTKLRGKPNGIARRTENAVWGATEQKLTSSSESSK